MTASPTPDAWDDPRFPRSFFGTLLHVAARDEEPPGAASGGLGHGEADEVAKDLVIARRGASEPARRGASEWGLLRLLSSQPGVPSRTAILDMLADPARHEHLGDIEVLPMPGADHFAFRRDGRFLSVDRAGGLGFVAAQCLAWETFEGVRPGPLAYQLWRPPRTMGGTQLMHSGLSARLGGELDAVNLMLNRPDRRKLDGRPLVVWLHNDAHDSFLWCAKPELVALVDAFVFVSAWQKQRFLARFGLPPERCHVIHNATDAPAADRPAMTARPWRLRCAYTSAPNRGLSILLDAWERIDPADAELHVWSSFRLWGTRFHDGAHHRLFDRARALPGVTYHGVRPNQEVRAALREMHFLTYPCTVPETSCLSALEAMAAGARVISTSLGALPETTAGFARLYDPPPDHEAHVAAFSTHLAEELASPWRGKPEIALGAQAFVRQGHGWDTHVARWRRLIASLAGRVGATG